MQKINIPLLGLTAGSEARAVRDGECDILHNMTVDSNGARVIAPPTSGVTSTGDIEEYFHAKANQWLTIMPNGYVKDVNGKYLNDVDWETMSKVVSLEFMGNVVVMYCADNTVRYALFYNGGYRYLGRLPELPRLKIEISPTHVTTLTKEAYYIDSVEVSADKEGLRWANASKGYFDECLRGLYQQGAFVDRTLLRVAARLFDGSYISFSPIYYVQDSDELIKNIGYYWLGEYKSIGRDNRNFFSCPRISDATNRSNFFASVRGFIPKLTPEVYDLTRWEDIIVAIEVFATPSIMGHESVNKGVTQEFAGNLADNWATVTKMNNYDRYVPKSGTKIREEVSKAALFYKIAEYDLKGKRVWHLEDTSPSQLAVQKALPLNEHPHELGGGYKYVYNSKMHLAGVTERFCDAYNSVDVPGGKEQKIVQITQVTTIGADEGEKKIVTTTAAPMVTIYDEENKKYCMTPLLHYPDARAKNIRLYVAHQNVNNGYTIVRRDFPLTAHDALNVAYYLEEASEGNEYATEVARTIANENMKVKVEISGKENAFVVAVKDKYPDRGDYSGTYKFTYTSNAGLNLTNWKLDITFANGEGNISGADASVFAYGLKLYDDGKEITALDVMAGNAGLLDGETITVTLTFNNSSYAGINPIKIGGEGWESSLPEVESVYDGNELLSFTVNGVTEERVFSRNNVMRVSEVDNPLFFPAKSTYSFDTDIVAVCSNTVAMSQGQFGQHPLYVFTKSGIWIMSVDGSGAGTYLSQVPCSREICNNGMGVTATGQGVVFPTTLGLMMINGTEMMNISKSIGGPVTPELKVSGDVVERICDIVGKKVVHNREAFRDYLAGAFTAYDHNTGLLYVCAQGKGYCYVYNMQSGVWSTADGSYYRKVEYPDKLMMADKYLSGTEWKYVRYTFNRYDKVTEEVPVVMVTRGCIFGETGFKRVGKSALRATLFGRNMGFYVLGSVDGVAWEIVAGREVVEGVMRVAPGSIIRDLVCRYGRSRVYRFFAFAFAGKVRSDAAFALIECEVKRAFGERIR